MYTLHKHNEWPHRILIKFGDKIIASTDRYYSSTRFDSAEYADAQTVYYIKSESIYTHDNNS